MEPVEKAEREEPPEEVEHEEKGVAALVGSGSAMIVSRTMILKR